MPRTQNAANNHEYRSIPRCSSASSRTGIGGSKYEVGRRGTSPESRQTYRPRQPSSPRLTDAEAIVAQVVELSVVRKYFLRSLAVCHVVST